MRKKLFCRTLLGGLAIALALSAAAGAAGASGAETRTVTVRTAQEFVDALGSDTTVLLTDGVYNLSETDEEGLSAEEKYWEDVWDGQELRIQNVHNLTIRGESPDCQIVVDPRDAHVLTFLDCTGIAIENVTMGHTVQSEVCDSGVLSFMDCETIRIAGARLFGCGTYGLFLGGVNGAKIESSSIYECTDGIMHIACSRDIAFTDCVFRDTEGGVSIDETDTVTFDRCQFDNLDAETLLYVQDSSGIVVQNSSFTYNAAEELHTSNAVRWVNNTFEGNTFEGAGAAAITLPADVKKAFEGAEWEGYEPVAGCFYHWPLVSEYVIVMQKDGHSVFCLLRGDGDTDGVRLVLSNGAALYQDGRVPSPFIEDAMGFIGFEYADERAAPGSPAEEGYVFCSRWFWEEEMERTPEGDWEYMLLEAYRLYPDPSDPDNPYADSVRYSMDFTDTGLRLESRIEYDEYSWDSWETLAEMKAGTAPYDLALFDIARCNADYEALMALAGVPSEGEEQTGLPPGGEPDGPPEISPGDSALAPFESNGRWGYADAAGAAVIPCQWQEVGAFTNGRAWVREDDGRWALIDAEGADLSAYRWDAVYPFHEGILSKDLALVARRDPVKGLLFGLAGADGKVAAEPKWSRFLPATEGVARVVADGLYGYVDRTGKVLVSPQFTMAHPFSQGLGRAAMGNRWGYITGEGKAVGQPWELATDFFEGRARVKKDGLFGFIDTAGELAVEPVWENAGLFREGYAAVYRDGLWGFIDAAGRVAAEPFWDEVRGYREGYAAVKKDGLWGFLGADCRLAIEPGWANARSFSQGLASVQKGDAWGYIDTAGRMVIEPRWGCAYEFCEGFAIVEADGLEGFIDATGRTVIEPVWDSAFDFDHGLACVRKGEKLGLIDASGEIVLDVQWDTVDDFYEGLACVEKDEKLGYADTKGQVVIEPKWDEAAPFAGGIAQVWKDDTMFFIDPEGRILR